MPQEPDELKNVRVIIRHIQSLTQETYVDLGAAIGMRGLLVGRRQNGSTDWSVNELGRIARHWGFELSCLFTTVKDAVAAMDEERLTELRAAKGLSPLDLKPSTPVAA
ncbi:hypothetical protein [Streptomyces sp. NPDC056056]|uniref:hypothetical protein n=1 Tax=Streptomyces sp. NPDC056056 TaxID=3345698 RepID=UPI0035DEA18C